LLSIAAADVVLPHVYLTVLLDELKQKMIVLSVEEAAQIDSLLFLYHWQWMATFLLSIYRTDN